MESRISGDPSSVQHHEETNWGTGMMAPSKVRNASLIKGTQCLETQVETIVFNGFFNSSAYICCMLQIVEEVR